MERELKRLRKRFEEIKEGGLYKSVCNGSVGIGQTFERLLGKKADTLFEPDYNGIEIKTKLGYTKAPLTLFSLIPKCDYEHPLELLVSKFGYPESSFSPFKVLRAEAYSQNRVLTAKKYYFELKVHRDSKKIRLVVTDKMKNIVNEDLYWNFDLLEERLVNKLSYMALVITYPYYRNRETYFKYFKMTLYKLRGFEKFLELIEQGIIKVVFNIDICKDENNYGRIRDHGTSFKIDNEDIYKLFQKLNI